MKFKPGQKVMCVRGIWWVRTRFWVFRWWRHPAGRHPEKGKIYTVQATMTLNDPGPGDILWLHEFPGYAYTVRSFEPVDESFSENILQLIKDQILRH